MALSKEQKKQIRAEWDQLRTLVKKFSKGSTSDLYVIKREPLLDGAKEIAQLLGVIPKAAHTRGRQNHSQKNSQEETPAAPN